MVSGPAEWIERIRTSGDRLAMPIVSYPGLSLIGGTVRDVTSKAGVQFDCIRAVGEAYPNIAALAPMDLSVEAEAFGARITFHDDEVPTVAEPLIHTPEDQEKLSAPQAGAARTAVYLEAAGRASEHFTDRPTFAGMIGPFSLAVRLRDMTQVLMDLMLDPDRVVDLLETCVDFQTRYAQAFKACGTDGVIMAEPAAGLLAPEHCEQFSSHYVRRIVDAVQDDSFLVILHNCGHVSGSIASMAGTGARGIHVGNAVKMLDVLPQVPSEMLAFGNIDPAGTMRNGTRDHVYAATKQLLHQTTEYRNFVLSSGCDIPPGTPLENIDAFFAALDDYNRARDLPPHATDS